MWPLGRHHSTRPARLRRAMTAIRASPSCTSTTTPPALRSSTAGSRRGGTPGGLRRRGSSGHCNQCGSRAARSATVRRTRARPLAGRARGIPLVLVSTRQPPAALLRQAVAHLAPDLPLLTDLGERFAAAGHDLALVGGPGARRPARPPVDRPRLHDLGPARRHRGRAQGLGQRDVGHGARVRHHRRPPGQHGRRGDHLPRRRLRRRRPASRSWRSATPSRTTWCGATSPSTRWPCGCPTSPSSTRTAAWSTSTPACCARRRRPRSRSATTRCG